MDTAVVSVLDRARERFPDLVWETDTHGGEASGAVPPEGLVEVVTWLRDEGGFDMLASWSAVDYLEVPEVPARFCAVAHLASSSSPERVRVRVWLAEGQSCPTLTGLWPGANFQEREMWDFFGIAFDGHPDLSRIFMPDEWEGHPQRKDYPLGGSNTLYHNGQFIPPPDTRGQPTTTTGYPGRTS